MSIFGPNSRNYKLSLAILAVLYTCCRSIDVLADSPQEIARRSFKSVVLLVFNDKYGQPASLGSGFFVEPGVVVTNLHVVDGATKGVAKLVGKQGKMEVVGILGIDQKHDLALLEVKGESKASLSLAPLDRDSMKIGDKVYVIGNPQGLEGTFSDGIVSGVRTVGEDYLLQITAPISPGSSGGPVLDKEGNVVGVAVATYQGGQNLNFAIPVEYIKALVQQKGERRKLATVVRSKESILVGLGERNVEGVVCSQFLWDMDYDNPHVRDQGFSFTIRNSLNEPIKNVRILMIFYDSTGQPIEFKLLESEKVVPPNLATRVNGSIDYSIKKLTTGYKRRSEFRDSPDSKIEYKVLDFLLMTSM